MRTLATVLAVWSFVGMANVYLENISVMTNMFYIPEVDISTKVKSIAMVSNG